MRAVRGIWLGRHPRTGGDRAYFVYILLLVGLVTFVPVGRMVWLGTTSEAGIGLLTAPITPLVTQLGVLGLWSGALLAGRSRGPAVLAPFLSHALSTSDVPRRGALRAPVVRAGLTVVAVTIAAAVLVAGSLLHSGHTTVTGMVTFVVAGAATGVITTGCWLLGQALPRTVTPTALLLVGLGALSTAIPALQPFTPWGWVGFRYVTATQPAIAPLAGLLVCTVVATASIPLLLDQLSGAALAEQSARWDTAAVHAGGMDLSSAASVYTARPRRGRHLRAVRPTAPLPLLFLRRGLIGALRTPGRLVAGILGLVAATTLATSALLVDHWTIGASAGVAMFIAAGPVTDGIRHAAQVASDLPLYGLSDARLLLLHALFPALLLLAVPAAVAVVAGTLFGSGTESTVVASTIGLLCGLLGRVNSALKGPMPPSLLTPIPTPAGDLAAGVRLVWALDGLILAALGGVTATMMLASPIPLLVMVAIQLGVGASRWRERR